MKHKESIYIKCPYYKHEDKKVIYCECLIEDTDQRILFNDMNAFKKHRDKLCKGNFSKCPIAEALDKMNGYAGRENEWR